MPQYVIDAPGGGGKVPINPDYIESVTDDAITFRNYEGHRFTYPLKTRPLANADGTPLAREPRQPRQRQERALRATSEALAGDLAAALAAVKATA